MSDVSKIYEKVINSNIIIFDEFFYIEFFLRFNGDLLEISDKKMNGYDNAFFKCRKLSYDIWLFLNQIDDLQDKEKMLLIFSLIESNICHMELNKNIITLESIINFLNLNTNIIKYVVEKINEQYFEQKEEYYKYELSKDFNRLYHSEKGVVLEHKEISDYLTLTAFWEKLGLNYFDIRKLPYDIYKQLSLMMSIETEVKNTVLRESTKGSKNNKNSPMPPNRRGR